VVHRLTAKARGLDGDGEVLFQLGLAGEVGEAPGAQSGFELDVVVLGGAGDQAEFRTF
jgi:hypothetical protein